MAPQRGRESTGCVVFYLNRVCFVVRRMVVRLVRGVDSQSKGTGFDPQGSIPSVHIPVGVPDQDVLSCSFSFM